MKRGMIAGVLLGLFGLLLPSTSLSASPKIPDIYKAAQKGDLAKVKKLVEQGVDINAGVYGITPLECAAENGKLNVVEYLLTKGAKSPEVAFEKAMRNKQINVAKFLIENQYIDININAEFFYSYLNDNNVQFEQRMKNVKDIGGEKLSSPQLIALVKPENYQSVIKYFNINISDKADKLGNSLLHIAARNNNLDLVKYLLENEFNVNILNNQDQTALYYAVTYFGPSINWDKPIIENETIAKIDFISDMPYFSDPKTIQQKQVSIVFALLDAGISINQQDKSGWTVLHFASAAFPAGLQELLISKGADISLKTNFGRNSSDLLNLRK